MIDVVIAHGNIQKVEPNTRSLAVPSKDSKVMTTNHPCSATECISEAISKCTVCSEYYCYAHVYGHAHPVDNFEIIK